MAYGDQLKDMGFDGQVDHSLDSGFGAHVPTQMTQPSGGRGRIPRIGRFKKQKVRRGVQRLRKATNRLGKLQALENPNDRQLGRIGKLEGRIGRLQDKFSGQIRNRIDKVQGRVDHLNSLESLNPRQENRMGRLERRATNLSKLLPQEPQATGGLSPLPEEAAPVEPTEEGIDYVARANELMAGLYPDPGKLNWETYFNNDLYNSSLDRGQEALDRYYRAKGLSNSGAAIQGNADFAQELIGKTTEQAMDRAENERSLRQQNADRLSNMLVSEAERAQRGEQNQFDRMFELMQLGLSQSPLAQGYEAAASSAGLSSEFGNALAQLTASQYPAVPPAAAFAHHSGPAPTYVPPFPSGPDNSASQAAAAGASGASNNDWTNAIIAAIPGIASIFN